MEAEAALPLHFFKGSGESRLIHSILHHPNSTLSFRPIAIVLHNAIICTEGVIMTEKSSSIFIRVDPTVKKQAEEVFSDLGLTASSAVNIFYRQVALQRCIPFQLTTISRPVSVDQITRQEFDAMIQEGLDAIQAGDMKPAQDVFTEMRRKYSI